MLKLGTQAVAEHVHGRLGRGVGRRLARREEGKPGGHIDDVPGLAMRHHLSGEQPRAVDHAAQVDTQNALPIVRGGVEHATGHADAGIVDDDIGCLEVLADPIGQRFHGIDIAHIHSPGPGLDVEHAAEFRGALGAVGVNIRGNDVDPPLRQRECGLAADTGACAGDQRQPPGQCVALPDRVTPCAGERRRLRCALDVPDEGGDAMREQEGMGTAAASVRRRRQSAIGPRSTAADRPRCPGP